jgi:hypothetical protein
VRWIALAAALAACDGTPGGATITVTSPHGLGELVPTRTLAIGWTVAGTLDPAAITVVLVSRDDQAPFPIVEHGAGAAGTSDLSATGFTWSGLDRAGHPVPSGYYNLAVDAGAGPIDAGDSHVVVVQGLAFTAPAPGGAPLTASKTAPLGLDFTTSTASTLDVALTARPPGGAAIVLKQVPVPGELRSIGRTVTWNATDATGAAVPPGTYTIGATITDAAEQVTYATAGGDVNVN